MPHFVDVGACGARDIRRLACARADCGEHSPESGRAFHTRLAVAVAAPRDGLRVVASVAIAEHVCDVGFKVLPHVT